MDSFGDDSSKLVEGSVDGTSRWAPTKSDAAPHD